MYNFRIFPAEWAESEGGAQGRAERGERVMSESGGVQGDGALTRGMSSAPGKRWLVPVKCATVHQTGKLRKLPAAVAHLDRHKKKEAEGGGGTERQTAAEER